MTHRSFLTAIGFVLGAATLLSAQEVRRARFGAWEASMLVDMMTDSISARAAMSHAADSSALILVACDRPQRVVSISTRMAQGDSQSTIRVRFDSNPPGPATQMWEYTTSRRTPGFIDYLARLKPHATPTTG